MEILLQSVDGYVKLRSKNDRDFIAKSDVYMFDDASVRYEEFNKYYEDFVELNIWDEVETVKIELSEDGEYMFYYIMQKGISEKDVKHYLKAFYLGILKPISENIEEGIFVGDIQFGETNIKIFVASNWVIFDREFPYARLMIGTRDRLIDVSIDDISSDSKEIMNFSKSFRQLMEYIDALYSKIYTSVFGRIQILKDGL